MLFRPLVVFALGVVAQENAETTFEAQLTECQSQLGGVQEQALGIQAQCQQIVAQKDQELVAKDGEIASASQALEAVKASAAEGEAMQQAAVFSLTKELEALKAGHAKGNEELEALKAGNAKGNEELGKAVEQAKAELKVAKAEGEKLKQEIEKLKASSSSRVSAIETLKSEVSSLKFEISVQEENAAKKSSSSILSSYSALLSKLLAVLTNEAIQPLSDLFSLQLTILKQFFSFASEQISLLSRQGSVLGGEVVTQVWNDLLQPLMGEGVLQAKSLYKQHLAEHMDVYVQTAIDAVAELDVSGKLAEAYVIGASGGKEVFTLILDNLIPVFGDALSSLDFDFSAVTAATTGLSAPLSLDIFGETFELENGLYDAAAYSLITLLAGYHGLYLANFLVVNFFLKLVLYRILWSFLIRRILVSLVFGLLFSLFNFVLSTVIFVTKLALCFGCCGLCFRRKSAAKQATLYKAQTKSKPNNNVVGKKGGKK